MTTMSEDLQQKFERAVAEPDLNEMRTERRRCVWKLLIALGFIAGLGPMIFDDISPPISIATTSRGAPYMQNGWALLFAIASLAVAISSVLQIRKLNREIKSKPRTEDTHG